MIYILILLLSLGVSNCLAQETLLEPLKIPKKVKLYALYTPSHKVFVDNWFMPTVNTGDFQVILECHNQECESGAFMKDGWLKTMLHKVDIVIRGIKENWGSFFIHSDVDIQFLAPIKDEITELMKTNDFVVQEGDGRGNMCAGFFACRGNQRTLALWQRIKRYMISTGNHDQNGLNRFLLKSNPYKLVWSLLPDEYYCPRTMWTPGKELKIPKNIKIHHANWSRGIEHKLIQLQYIRDYVSKSHA